MFYFLLFFLQDFSEPLLCLWASQVALVVKNPPANAGVVRDTESIPGLVRSPREGDVNTLTHTKQMCMLMNIKACYQECS